ncbi:MAG: DUF1080 domain-containing protein [Verrucomicrobia bacterium]|nr:DUF1080 domain-containing protein [Verrucomicrobiota bacterium]
MHYGYVYGSVCRAAAVALCLELAGSALRAADDAGPPPNTLTPAEQAAGWRLLFDGQSPAHWRAFGKPGFPAQGWVVENGWLKKVAGIRGGDIITRETFTDFEFAWEWRFPARANNGVKYFVVEKRGAVGHEYQMIDDSGRGPSKGGTASFYEVLPPKAHAPVRLAPHSNQARIRVRGNRVEHWLNGEKVLEYDCGSDPVMAGVARSKFKNVNGFGRKLTGHILLTDHGSECAFRNLKVRPLPAAD